MQSVVKAEEMLSHMPGVSKWERALRELHLAWRTIESTARMVCPVEARTILPTVRATRDGFSHLEKQLITNLVRECTAKCAQEIHFKSRVIIDIVVRNLFERTADVGFLAMDQAIRDFILDEARDPRRILPRLQEYRDKYTVYDEILILDTRGKVLAHLDTGVPLEQSQDPLIAQTLACDTYVETFRRSDLRPGHDDSLIYSRKITHPQTGQPIGVLCLCFPLAVEMAGVFAGLSKGGGRAVMLMLDGDGRVIATSDPEHVRKGTRLQTALDGEYGIVSHAGRDYFAKTCAAQDYQGYRGPGWFGHVMIPCDTAFRHQQADSAAAADASMMAGIMAYAESFCPPLHEVALSAEEINFALRRVIWNGQIMCAGDNTELLRLKAVLQEISQTSDETSRVFHDSIDDLYATVLSSSLQDIQSVSRLVIDIMDRNLYERANDCRWWALTPDIRRTLADKAAGREERQRITTILEGINALYTAYVRLVVFNTEGTIVAASNPHGDDVEAVGKAMDAALVRKTLSLRDTQAYCVSPFETTWLYGGRPTYVYCAAIRHPDDNSRVAGGIGIVFDAEPEFRNMLLSTLPKRTGAFAAFTDRQGKVISSTRTDCPPGSRLGIDAVALAQKNGITGGKITVHDGEYVMLGYTTSFGYREYKNSGDYQNDVIALVCVPIGAVVAAPEAEPVRGGIPAKAHHGRNGERKEFAVFSINGGLFAMPASDVVEAAPAAGICQSATLKPPLAGMLNYAHAGNEASALLPVVDLHHLIRTDGPAQPSQGEVLVVRNGSRLFGMLVSTLDRVLDVGGEEIEPAIELFHGGPGYVRQMIKSDALGGMIQVLDPARVAKLVF